MKEEVSQLREEVSQRIMLIINRLGLNKNQFAQKLEFANVVITNITNQRNLPSFDFLYRLKRYDDKIDLNWLVYGEGNTFITENQNNPSENIELYKTLVATLQSENALLKEKIENSKQTNDSKNKKIS